jgi:hypothetical protein
VVFNPLLFIILVNEGLRLLFHNAADVFVVWGGRRGVPIVKGMAIRVKLRVLMLLQVLSEMKVVVPT